jgi:peroxiredoxin
VPPLRHGAASAAGRFAGTGKTWREAGGISPQAPVNSRRSARENKLSFPTLSNAHNDVAAAFSLRLRLPDHLIDLYRVFKNDLAVNGDENWILPMPARFVIAQDGTIAYAEVNPDYPRRPDPSKLLSTLVKVATIAP